MHQAAVRHGTRILRLGSIALAVGLAATLFVALTPGDAYAHGSRYAPPPQPDPPPPPPPPPEAFGEPKRGPVGKPPPPSPGRRPGPITPPSRPGVLPPQYGDPPNPVTPGPGARTPPPTVTPPTPTPPVTTPPTTGGRRPPIRTPLGAKLGKGRTVARTQNGESTWQMWWALNRLAYLPDRIEAELGEATVTPREGDLDPNTQWAARRAFVAGRHIVPLLLKLTDPKAKVRDDVRASALIALGKICRTSAVTERMFHWLEDERASQLVRESAALAVGLVARSGADRQFGPQFLDSARDRLLQAFDDPDMPYRARVFAVLAIGLLGDQPYTGPYAKDGRLISRALWKRLEDHHAHRGMTVALLTAIGQHPEAGIPDGVREGLSSIVTGRRVLGRKWDPNERSHALTAALRIGGPGRHALLLRTLARRRENVAVRRAAYLAIGGLADGMDAVERAEIAQAVLGALNRSRDPLTTGVAQIAVGHLLGSDLRAGETKVFETAAERELLAWAKRSPTPTRGFSAIALAIALRDVTPHTTGVGEFLADGQQILLAELERGRGDDRLQASYAVAVGLAGLTAGADLLMEIASDENADPVLRGHAVVALGQVGEPSPEVQRVLFLGLAQRRYAELRRQSALGLALLGGKLVGTHLLRELRTGETEQLLSQVVIALGRLGDLQAVGPLATFATDDSRSELTQALAVVALGMLADPEPRPTLLKLTQHANYPARTSALHEAFTIL